jgi:predicted nucleic acid-binding protein
MVFDTMVLAYALINVPEFREDAQRAIERAREIVVPDLFHAELVNVVWQWIKARRLTLEAGLEVLRRGEQLPTRVVSVRSVWERALALSLARSHSAYDTLFVALAIDIGSRVVSNDRQLQRRFPEHVLSVAQFLAEPGRGRR